jgi:hypothetical protein
MRRTELLQGLRLMKFEEVYGRTCRGRLRQAEAAEILDPGERSGAGAIANPLDQQLFGHTLVFIS